MSLNQLTDFFFGSTPTVTPSNPLAVTPETIIPTIPRRAKATLASPSAKILTLSARMQTHVLAAYHAQDLYPSPATLYRILASGRKRKEFRVVGQILLSHTGRPTLLYCNGYKPKHELLRHELLLTDFCLYAYPNANVLARGPHVDKKIRPDAEIELNGRRLFVELDTGTESYAQIEKKATVNYKDVSDIVLFVTLSKQRLQGLLEVAKAMSNITMFTTLQDAVSDPYGPMGSKWPFLGLRATREKLLDRGFVASMRHAFDSHGV